MSRSVKLLQALPSAHNGRLWLFSHNKECRLQLLNGMLPRKTDLNFSVATEQGPQPLTHPNVDSFINRPNVHTGPLSSQLRPLLAITTVQFLREGHRPSESLC